MSIERLASRALLGPAACKVTAELVTGAASALHAVEQRAQS
jgi:hypothetical protein